MSITKRVRNGDAEPLIRCREFRITAVTHVACESGGVTQIFLTRLAEFANSAGPCQPWNPDAVADLVSPRVRSAIDHAPDDLMAGNYRKLWIRQIAIHNVKIRPAHGASTNPDEYFTRFQFGLRQVRFLEYILRLEQDHCAHVL